jgi:hypothetical protein
MRVDCGWCGVRMRDGEGPEISHGICPVCFEREMNKLDTSSRPSCDEGGPSQSCGGSGAGLGDRSQRGRDALWPLSTPVTWALFGLAYVALALSLWR